MKTRVLAWSQALLVVAGAVALTAGRPLLPPDLAASAAVPPRPVTVPRPAVKAQSPVARPDPATASPKPRPRAAAGEVTVQLTVPRAAAKAAPKPRPQATSRRVAPKAAPPVRAASAQQRMEQAVARIPGYHRGAASWVLSNAYGSWGTADWYHDRVYISPRVPASRIYDVVSHEWAHLQSVRAYAGNVTAATTAMNRWFGGSNLVGAERAADCMARQLGARWTNYTTCADGHGQQGARLLLRGQPLPAAR